MTAKVSKEDVERVAALAHLELGPEEQARMLKDLNSILEYVAELNEVDTEKVEPLEQVSALGAGADRTVLREDEVRTSLDRVKVMAAAPDSDGAFFKVPKVIER